MTAWDDVDTAFIKAVAPIVQQLEDSLAAATAIGAGQLSQITALNEQNTQLNLQLGAALERIKVLEGQVPEPPPVQHKTVFGTSAGMEKGGTSLAAQSAAVAKWGKGIAIRQFLGAFTQTAPRDPNAGLVHISWKPANVAAITDAAVTAACKNLKAGDYVEVWHEMDVKDRKGTLAPADAFAMKTKFHDTVKKVRPDLNTIHTLSAWTFEPTAKLDPEKYVAKADYVGIDCDGTSPTKLPYTSYMDEIKAIKAFTTKHNYKGYAVPEFGCVRIASVDPDGTERAKWISTYASIWKADPQCAFVTAFEYNTSPYYTLDKAPEIAVWKGYTS